MMNVSLLAMNIIPWNIAFVSFVFDVRFPLYFGQLKTFLENALQFSCIFYGIEIYWIKYWITFVWKSVRSIDDQFVVAFFSIINIFLSLLIAFLRFQFMDLHVMKYGIVEEIDICEYCRTPINIFG